jgi:hypothetical protein
MNFLLLNLKFCYPVRKSPPLDHIRSQMNPVHTQILCNLLCLPEFFLPVFTTLLTSVD